MKTWQATIMTSLPSMFPGPLSHSLVGSALEKEIWSLNTVDLRDFANDKRGTIDDRPYGGGPGMIIRPDIVENTIKKNFRKYGK